MAEREGASQSVSSPFQVQGCQNLPFKPEIKAYTQGQASKANGASLDLDFKDRAGQANVQKTILTIPSSLPARLTTIQKSCLAKTFEENPASCPEGSDIGQAVVHTPVLKAPLEGPIYLVSHGNAAWPDAELVLQGEGITVILDGQTAIKKGITTSSFLSVPDAPFSSLEATLPQGPHSALTANVPEAQHYSLCSQKLSIPAQLAGQNGAELNEKVPVSIQGCHAVKAAKAKKLTRAQKLKKALASCRKRFRHSKARRQSCERKARRAYGAHAAKKAKHGKGGKHPKEGSPRTASAHRQLERLLPWALEDPSATELPLQMSRTHTGTGARPASHERGSRSGSPTAQALVIQGSERSDWGSGISRSRQAGARLFLRLALLYSAGSAGAA